MLKRETGGPTTGTIRLRRERNFRDKLRKYGIHLDDRGVGHIEDGDS